jgi:hypothetical protein
VTLHLTPPQRINRALVFWLKASASFAWQERCGEAPRTGKEQRKKLHETNEESQRQARDKPETETETTAKNRKGSKPEKPRQCKGSVER